MHTVDFARRRFSKQWRRRLGSKGVVARGVGRRRAKITIFFYAFVFFVGDGLSAQALMRSWTLDVFLPSLPFVFLFSFFCFLRPFRQDLAGEGPCGGRGDRGLHTHTWITQICHQNGPAWSQDQNGPEHALAGFGPRTIPDHPGGFTTIW